MAVKRSLKTLTSGPRIWPSDFPQRLPVVES